MGSSIFTRNAVLTIASSARSFAVPFQLAEFVFHDGSESKTADQQDHIDKEEHAGDQAGDQQSSCDVNVTEGPEKRSGAQ